MKTSKMIKLFEDVAVKHYTVDQDDIGETLIKKPVKGALVHFKDNEMNILFNFTKDTISIYNKTHASLNKEAPNGRDNVCSKINKIAVDYKKIKDKLITIGFKNPVLNSSIDLDCFHSQTSPFMTMNFSIEQKDGNPFMSLSRVIQMLPHSDMKDVSVLTKSMFRMPRIFKYTAQ